MNSSLPPLDMHAHVDVGIPTSEIDGLQAAVFAVTRSLEEASRALKRQDRAAVWGVGCHPGLVQAQRAFSTAEFEKLVELTAFVGELGLDGKSSVPMDLQRRTLDGALASLEDHPRIVSIHSYGATREVLEILASRRVKGVILHWWLGDSVETRQAIDLGCFFSVNASTIRRDAILASIPIDRLLTETDHPFGDRYSRGPRRPGAVADVESAVARVHGITAADVRLQVWRNLRRLATETGTSRLLPRVLVNHLAAA